jgi:hypothetical protein
MTMTDTVGSNEVPVKEPVYTLAPEAIEATGRSLSIVLGDRLCEAALAKVKIPGAWRGMSYKELSKLLKDNCADQDGYVSPQQPVLETAFRLLLVAPAGKLSLNELHRQIAELWMSSPWPRHISSESLQRLLDNGISYGIIAVDS